MQNEAVHNTYISKGTFKNTPVIWKIKYKKSNFAIEGVSRTQTILLEYKNQWVHHLQNKF